jgi:PAS domain S-box-containing protein
LRYKPEDVAGHVRTWQQWIHPDDRAHVKAALDAYVEGRTPVYQSEHRLRTKDGQWTWSSARGTIIIRDTPHRARRIIVTYTDITDRKHVEVALSERNEWLRLAMTAGKIGTFEWNVQSGRASLSQEFERIYGFEPGSLEGMDQSWVKHVHPEDWAEIEAKLNRAFARRESEFGADFRIIEEGIS